LEREDARRYIKIFAKRAGQDFNERFRGASAEAIDLLKRMLVFNPANRITVQQCLNHPLFRDIRVPAAEPQKAERVVLPFDDYQPMEEPQLRYQFIREIRQFHPEVQIPEQLMYLHRHE